VPNAIFLNGITRQRVIELLRGDGITVEATLRYADFLAADEIFSTGNFAKVAPVIRIDDRPLTPGPFYARARKLYRDFAHMLKLAAREGSVRCSSGGDSSAAFLPVVPPTPRPFAYHSRFKSDWVIPKGPHHGRILR
jgi:hypothetical protein